MNATAKDGEVKCSEALDDREGKSPEEEDDDDGAEDDEILEVIRKHYAASGEDIVLVATVPSNAAPAQGDIPMVPHPESKNEKKSHGPYKYPFAGRGADKAANEATRQANNESLLAVGITVDTTASQPGAFALPGIGIRIDDDDPASAGDGPLLAIVDIATASQSAATTQDGILVDTQDDIVALAVEEGQHGDLQQAEPVHSNDARLLPSQPKKRGVTYAFTIFLIAGALILLLVPVVLCSSSYSGHESAVGAINTTVTDPDANFPTSSAAPTSVLEGPVLKLFPDHTIDDLEDPQSAQSMALQWLLSDPFLPQYIHVEWRVRQRFALATLYHATGGNNWTSRCNWLSYEVHECLWFSGSAFGTPDPILQLPTYKYSNPCELPPANITHDNSSNNDNSNHNDLLDDNANIYVFKHLWL